MMRSVKRPEMCCRCGESNWLGEDHMSHASVVVCRCRPDDPIGVGPNLAAAIKDWNRQWCEASARKAEELPKRPLRVEWTTEMADDLEALHGDRGPFLTTDPMDEAVTLGGYSDDYIEGFAKALRALLPEETKTQLMERGMQISKGGFNPKVLAKYLGED